MLCTVIVVQLLSCVQLFVAPWTAAHQASLSFTVSQSLLKLMLSQWCRPTISSCHPLLLLPSIFPSIRIFCNGLVLRIRWPKYWSFSISPSNEYPWLISFRIDWFGLLAVQCFWIVVLEKILAWRDFVKFRFLCVWFPLLGPLNYNS